MKRAPVTAVLTGRPSMLRPEMTLLNTVGMSQTCHERSSWPIQFLTKWT
jgi:hypothetical protein